MAERGIDWNKKRNFGNIFILTTLILPIRDKGRLRHLSMSEEILEIRGVKLADARPDKERVILIPKYLNPDKLN